jgi:hypothetical protein
MSSEMPKAATGSMGCGKSFLLAGIPIPTHFSSRVAAELPNNTSSNAYYSGQALSQFDSSVQRASLDEEPCRSNK